MNLEKMGGSELISYRDDLREFLDKSTQQSYIDASRELNERLRLGEEAVKIIDRINELIKHVKGPNHLAKCIDVLLFNWKENL